MNVKSLCHTIVALCSEMRPPTLPSQCARYARAPATALANWAWAYTQDCSTLSSGRDCPDARDCDTEPTLVSALTRLRWAHLNRRTFGQHRSIECGSRRTVMTDTSLAALRWRLSLQKGIELQEVYIYEYSGGYSSTSQRT